MTGEKMQQIEPWLSVEDIARHLGVSKKTIYLWLERDHIPARRLGKLWKLKPSEVDAWVMSENPGDGKNGPKGLRQ